MLKRIIYIYNINVENVTNMEYMFYYCNNLKTINLSNLDAKNVLNMEYMFAECWSLTKINLSRFHTEKI